MQCVSGRASSPRRWDVWPTYIGNRPILIVSQLFVALGPLFYLAATPERPWILGGAYGVWIAYAGLNVCLINLMLKLAPGGDSPSYIACYFALGGLCLAGGTLLGGGLLEFDDSAIRDAIQLATGLDRFQQMFALGTAGRLAAVLLLLKIVEPGARRLGEVLRGTDQAAAE